jgi:hypothetical protein
VLPSRTAGRTIGRMTSRSPGSKKARRLSPEQEAFASWFVKWWQRRERHIDFSANAAPADQKEPPAVSEIDIWRETPEPIRRPDGTRERLEPAALGGTT